ncbi:MAG: cytochrome P460 family protein [Deltaproteobacteria bacterium]|nr:cytochrome P460 family protein [Deltaproteobacteria bacterium]
MRDWLARKTRSGERILLLTFALFGLPLLASLEMERGKTAWAQTPSVSPVPVAPCGEGTGTPCSPQTQTGPSQALKSAETGPPPAAQGAKSAPTVPANPTPAAESAPLPPDSGANPAPAPVDTSAAPPPSQGAPEPATSAVPLPGTPAPNAAAAPGTSIPGTPADAAGSPNPASPDQPPVDSTTASPENPDNPVDLGPVLDFIRGEGDTLGWGNEFRSWLLVTGYLMSPAHGNRVVQVYVQPASAAKVYLFNAEQARLRQTTRFKPYPPGTAIAMESWLRSDTGAPGKPGPLFFMRKENGFDPSGGDWNYGFTRRDMTILGQGNTGSMAFCKECHGEAGTRDFVWASR